jgi:replicative DNA helicase
MAKNQNNNFEVNKIPPQDKEAERSLIGSLMLDKKAISKVVDFLTPEDFYRDTNKKIYEAMVDLFEKQEPIDLLSITTRLKEKKELKNVGGSSYLSECVNSVPTASHVLNYAKIIQKKRILRDLIGASYDIGELGYNEKEDIDVTLDKAEKRIFSVAQQSLTQSFAAVKDNLEEAFRRIDMLSKNKNAIRGASTGFVDLDKITAGFQKSNFIILAGRPSLGKSSLALDFARNIATHENTPVGIFSLEMSTDQIVDRLIASESNVDLWKIRTGYLSDSGENNDFVKIQRSLDTLSQAPIYIDDAANINILQMRAMARRLQAEKGLGLIIIDYIQLIEPKSSFDSIVRQVTEVSRSLKGLAKELNVPVLALSQLSRAVEQRTPQVPRLSDLRESGALEQDADVVMFIHREDRYRPETSRKNIADIIVAKHRNGPIGKVELFFNERLASFRNLEK